MSTKELYLFVLVCFCCRKGESSSERLFMEDECGKLVDMPAQGLESLRVKLTKYQLYHNAIDCVFRIKAPENKRLEVKILRNNIERSDNCSKDFLQIYDGPELTNAILQGLDRQVCSSSTLQRSYASTSDYITLRFKSDESEALDGFWLQITAFRSDPDDVCDSNEFQCNSNKRCISEHLVCDRFEDCADASDECLLSTPAIIGIAVGGVTAFLLIVGIFICVCCYRSRRVRTGSTKPLSQHDTSDGATTPVEDYKTADIQLYRPISYHQPVRRDIPENYPIYTVNGPKADTINTRHVWITAPPEVTYIYPRIPETS